MKAFKIRLTCYFILAAFNVSFNMHASNKDTIPPLHKVLLPQAHIGDIEIDTKLLDSYGLLPENIRQFYFNARSIFSENFNADFTNQNIIEAAQKFNLPLMGGPMLGNLNETSATIWLRPSTKEPLLVKVTKLDGNDQKSFLNSSIEPGVEQRIVVSGLSSDTEYNYAIYANDINIAEGKFRTAPASGKKGVFKLAFGSCFHKIGLHNPNLINQILKENL